jgi:hypothetical protein
MLTLRCYVYHVNFKSQVTFKKILFTRHEDSSMFQSIVNPVCYELKFCIFFNVDDFMVGGRKFYGRYLHPLSININPMTHISLDNQIFQGHQYSIMPFKSSRSLDRSNCCGHLFPELPEFVCVYAP